jgi:hypothetical protein
MPKRITLAIILSSFVVALELFDLIDDGKYIKHGITILLSGATAFLLFRDGSKESN